MVTLGRNSLLLNPIFPYHITISKNEGKILRMKDMVNIKGLVKRFGDITAINNVNLRIGEGEIYGLLGPNGAGKTTAINILCGMLKKDKGEVEIFGKSIDKSLMEIKQDIGVVPQNIAIYNDLTAKENVMFFASLYGLRGKELKQRSDEALRFVGLTDRQTDFPKVFSGGMKRRLNIACAIAHRPRLIIMDEPTVGIDPQSRNHILNSIKKLNEMGSTIINTTHYMEEAEYLCTRIGIIDHGKLIAEGTSEELKSIVTDVKSVAIETGIGQNIDLSGVDNIKGVVSVNREENMVIIEFNKESDCVVDIVIYFSKNKITIRDIKMKGASLESAFLSLTGRKLRD